MIQFFGKRRFNYIHLIALCIFSSAVEEGHFGIAASVLVLGVLVSVAVEHWAERKERVQS